MSKFVVDGSDDNFEAEVLNSDIPVLVDFWAPWCGPCKSIAPVVEELAQEYQGRLKVVKVNVDENPNYAAKFKVRGIPNIIIFKNGEIQGQIVGDKPKNEIVGAIQKVV